MFQRTHHGLFHGFWFLALLHHPHLLCVSIVTNIPIMTTTSAPVTLICSLQSKSVPSLSPYVWSLSPGSPILSDGQSQSGVCSNALISTQAHWKYVSLHAFLQNTLFCKYELYCTYESQQFPVEMNTRGSKTYIPFHINDDLQGQSFY